MTTATGIHAPLAPGQGRLWFAEQLAPGASGYVVQRAVRLSGPLDEALLRRAVAHVVDRHGVLRTTYDDGGPRPEQVQWPRVPDVFAVHDVSPGQVGDRIAATRRRPFDLREQAPLRAELLRTGPGEAVLVLTVHHIAIDGWSMAVLMDEVPRAYRALAAGREPELPPAPRFVDYALRESARTPAPAELEHWRRTLAGADPLSGPEPDLSPPLHRTGRAHARTVRLSGPECARIAGLSRVFRCTPFATVLACYAGALHGAGAAPDLVVAIPFSGRMRAEDHRLVGFLVNVLPIRLHCDESTTLTRLLAEVREAYLTASEHADVPYERIVAASVVRRIPRRTQLAQVAYDLHPAPALPDFPGVAAAEWHLEPVATRLEVELHVTFARDGATAHVLASADLFTADTAEYLRAVFGQVVARWPADPGTPLGRVLPAVEEDPS